MALMTASALSWAIGLDGISPSEKLVLVMMAYCSYSVGEESPETILLFPRFADQCCIDVVTMEKIISVLKKNNFIEEATPVSVESSGMRRKFILRPYISVNKNSENCDMLQGYQPGDSKITIRMSGAIDSETNNQSLASETSDKNPKTVEKNSATYCLSVPLKSGQEYKITDTQKTEWVELFPNIDVMQQLKLYKAWTLGNPDRRKTRRGILRSITAWLIKAQNENPAPPPKPKRQSEYIPPQPTKPADPATVARAMAVMRKKLGRGT